MMVENPPKPPKPTKPRCGAKTRAGGTCQLAAGFRTDHPGEGRCRFHGGATPVKHGRYSSIKRPRIKQLLEEYEKDPEPMNLLPEVKLLRALTTDFVERWEHFTDITFRWHTLFHKDYVEAVNKWRAEVRDMLQADADELARLFPEHEIPPVPDPSHYTPDKPRQILDITAAAGLVDKIGAMVDRIEKHRKESAITLETLEKVLELVGVELVRAVQDEVSDAAVRARLLANFERRWASLHIDAQGSASSGTSSAVN